MGMTIYNGDCLEVMHKLSTGGVDVVFTSPPYNDSGYTEADRNAKRHFKYKTAEYREDWFEWQCECIDEMLRIASRQVLYNVQPILSNKADVYRLIGRYADKLDQILVWYKPNAQPQHYPHRIANAYEIVLILRGAEFDKLYVNSNGYRNVIVKSINTDHSFSDIHRAVMNKSFCDEIIREFTMDGDTVLDPYMGLGTTGISCLQMGREFIGIEIDPEYCRIAEERLHAVERQTTLFTLPIETAEQIAL